MERREFLQWALGAAVLTIGQREDIERMLAEPQPVIDPSTVPILSTWYPSVAFKSSLPAEAIDKSLCWVEDEETDYMRVNPIGWVELEAA